jgi:hypothetical protein
MSTPSGRKKVILRKFSREWVAGYIPPSNFVHDGQVELLDLAGKLATVPVEEIKWLCFVRDFNSGEADNPERLLRKLFAGRPRGDGLWLRIRLLDGDRLEGLAANDLAVIDDRGIFLTPPDLRSNTQRIFVPKPSIAEFEVAAVITSPTRRKTAHPAPATQQEELFSDPD